MASKEVKAMQKAIAGIGKPLTDAREALRRAETSDPAKIEKLKAEVLRQLYASKELESAARAYTEKVIAEDDDGTYVEFTGPPTRKMSLRGVARSQGITQSQLARKAKMDPAMLSRVLRDPESSQLRTLRRIAKALNVELSKVL